MTDEPYSKGGIVRGPSQAIRLVPRADPTNMYEMSWDEGIYCPGCQSLVPALVWTRGRHRCDADGSGAGQLHALILDMPDEMRQAWAAIPKQPGWCPTCRNGTELASVPYRCTACGTGNR